MESLELIREVDKCLTPVLKRGMGRDGLAFQAGYVGDDPELRAVAQRLMNFFDMVNESYRFAEDLANGRLETQPNRGNVLAMPLKALQSHLAHLSWQARQVADGDLSQQVHFLGRFSESFNQMIGSLREKALLERRLQAMMDVLGEGVLLVDAEGCLIFMNPEAERLLGYTLNEVEGKALDEVIHVQQTDGTFLGPNQSGVAQAVRANQEYRSDLDVFTCKSGRILPVSVVCRPLEPEQGGSGAVIAFSDVTEQKKYQESLELINEILEKQASTDPLTGIFNRMKFSTVLGGELKRAQRYGTPLAVILLDIDKFKSINDTYGHLDGDNVLKALTRLLAANIRTSDTLARWGGEEFILLAPGSDLDSARLLAEKLRLAVAEYNFPIPRSVTSSFGVASYQPGDTELALTNRADQALYRAKEQGRNRVEVMRT